MLPTNHSPTPSRSSSKRWLLLLVPSVAALLLVGRLSEPTDVQLRDYLTAATNGNSLVNGTDKAWVAGEGEGVQQLEVPEWTEQEEQLRQYRWETPEVHETLKRALERLDEVSAIGSGSGRDALIHQDQDERRTRDWLLATRPFASRGVGIGLGASSPPETIRPGSPATTPRALPGPREGPGAFGGGSYAK